MLKKLSLLLLVISTYIYSTPIISIKSNKLKLISKSFPYIYGRKAKSVYLLGEKKVLKDLENHNIEYRIVSNSEKKYEMERKSIISNENFVKYDEIKDKIDELVLRYPNIIEKIVIGKSVEGREIIGIKTIMNTMSPKYRIVGGIHGNEAMSYQFVFDFMVYLIENNKKYLDIINNTQIYFIPMLNPDGAVNITRRNSNNIDLNRNLGFFWKEIIYSGEDVFTEPETIALRDFTLTENFTMSFSFHTFGDIINYVWNFSPDKVPDTYEILKISKIYESFTNYKVTEGYDWYQTTGDLNDYSYGTRGTLDWTIEIDDSDPKGELFENNKNALIEILETYQYGVEGVIYDNNNLPLNASIIIDGNSLFYSNNNGYFYRYLLNGLHHIKVIAEGYDIYEDFIKVDNDKPFLKIHLIKSKKNDTLFIDRIISVKAEFNKYDYFNVLLPENLLFYPDDKYFYLPFKGEVMVELPLLYEDKLLEIKFLNYFDINLKIEGYDDLNGESLFSKNYNKETLINITKNIRYLKIINESLADSTFMDSILLKDDIVNDNDNDYVYKGSALCSFNNINNNNLFILLFFILSVFIFKRRKYIEKK